MKPLEKTYRGGFFKNRHKLSWRAPIVCTSIADIMMMDKGDSVIDVGCAIGDLVEEFKNMGYDSIGIEGSKSVRPFIITDFMKIKIMDLRLDLDYSQLNIPYNMLTCFEVIEHIEPEYEAQLLLNLCTLSNHLVISAAPPGQRGLGHVNCQPPSYWIKKFDMYNFKNKPHLENRFKAEWHPWRKKPGIKAFYDNILVFERM